MKKNFKFMLVALLAVFGYSSMSAQAIVGKTQETANGLLYTVKAVYKTPTDTKVNTVTVAQTNWATKAADPANLEIPSTVTFNVKGTDTDGNAMDAETTFTVVEIAANGFQNLDCIEQVTLPNTITTINAGAFSGTSISELDLSTTKITTLEKLFEDNNVALTKVKLPATLTTMATDALGNCIQLAEVDFSLCTELATINNGALANTVISSLDFSTCAKLINLSAVTPFVNATATTNSNLAEITLPTTLAGSIGTAFAKLEALTTINLDKTAVTTIPTGAFDGDAALSALATGNKVTSIAGSPFTGCVSLASLTIDATSLTTLGTASTNLFGAATDDLAALETLKITGDILATATIQNCLNGCTSITTVEIAKGKEIKAGATLTASSISVAEDANITLGKLSATANGFIVGPGATKTIESLTLGEINVDLSAGTAIVTTAIIETATVGKISAGFRADVLGQAEKIVFDGEIANTLTATTTANDALTEIDFGTVKIAAGYIVAKSFDETLAPNLVKVTWNPADADAVAAFAKEAFGTATKGAAAVVELYTTTKVATDLYANLETNLFNVIFKALAASSEIEVYGNASAQYFYGKFQAAAASNYEIAKVNADGDQVVVYSAFVDAADNKIYMDPLALNDGRYIVAKGEAVVVRVKAPTTTEEMTKPAGGLKAKVTAKATDDDDTMRQVGTIPAILNDLNLAATVISSDDMPIKNPGKTYYAMKNPASVGALDWGLVGTTSYVPAGALYVLTDGVAAARLDIVWLDGSNDATAIINKINNVEEANDGVVYNLQGVRVSGTQKGIYIKNGKKFIVK